MMVVAESPPADAEDVLLPMLGALCILAASIGVCVWLLQDLPNSLKELVQLLRGWSAVHEVVREVDCTPWGLEKKFVILQDTATTVPAKEPLCSWAAVPGRKWEFGLALWNGAVAMTKLLVERRSHFQSGIFGSGRTVLELGCGQALVSMVVFELFPDLQRIVATDGVEDIFPAAGANIAANLGSCTEKLVLAKLMWARSEDIERALLLNHGKTYDVILGADITYADQHDELIETILQLSHAETEVWITHEPRRQSTERLINLMKTHFETFEETELTLPPYGRYYTESITILCWHCVGKKAVARSE